MRRTALICLALFTAPAHGDELPADLAALLAAAAETGEAETFADAVRLIALTRPADEIAAAADALGRGDTARDLLGLDSLALAEDVAIAEAETAEPLAAEPEGGFLSRTAGRSRAASSRPGRAG
ncbi:MAG: hypothetical protein ABL308_01385 [Oceanicaulis sp.]